MWVHIAVCELVAMNLSSFSAYPEDLKARLVSIGLFALSRGELQMVQAVTCLIAKGGLAHE
jgi:hypothetical protein